MSTGKGPLVRLIVVADISFKNGVVAFSVQVHSYIL